MKILLKYFTEPKIFWILFLTVVQDRGLAQSFNNRYDFLELNNSETPWSIEENSSGQIVVFIPHDGASGWNNLGTLILSADGAIANGFEVEIDSTNLYAGLSNSANKVSAGGFILGNSKDPWFAGDSSQLCLFRFNESGDTLWHKSWPPILSYQGNIGYAAIETTDGGFLVVGTTYQEANSKVLAIKTDADGNEVWYKTYSGYPFNSRNAAVSACNSNDGGYIVGAQSEHEDEDVDNHYFFKIASNGELEWERVLESVMDDGTVKLLNYGDGIYYGSGLLAYYIFDDDAKPWLMKFNDNGDTLWTRTYGDDTMYARYFSHPKKLSDGNLLLGGQWPGEGFDKGFLMKLDTAGNVIWDRKFFNVDGNHCRFTDYIELSDGYIAACGMASADNGLGLNQDSWVVKVDECGCLVPGCENGASCSVGMDQTDNDILQAFHVYPNPVNGILNIFLEQASEDSGKSLRFDLVSMQGDIVKSFEAPFSDTTYMTDVTSLSNGTYLLVLRAEGAVLQTERIIVE